MKFNLFLCGAMAISGVAVTTSDAEANRIPRRVNNSMTQRVAVYQPRYVPAYQYQRAAPSYQASQRVAPAPVVQPVQRQASQPIVQQSFVQQSFQSAPTVTRSVNSVSPAAPVAVLPGRVISERVIAINGVPVDSQPSVANQPTEASSRR